MVRIQHALRKRRQPIRLRRLFKSAATHRNRLVSTMRAKSEPTCDRRQISNAGYKAQDEQAASNKYDPAGDQPNEDG
jgi:hypothetical protein